MFLFDRLETHIVIRSSKFEGRSKVSLFTNVLLGGDIARRHLQSVATRRPTNTPVSSTFLAL